MNDELWMMNVGKIEELTAFGGTKIFNAKCAKIFAKHAEILLANQLNSIGEEN